MNITKFVTLGLLGQMQSGSGYDIIHEIDKRLLSMWTDIKPGSVYNALSTLEKEGAIEQAGKETEQETALDRAPPVVPREEPAYEALTPEIQKLIERDQELTPLCWGTVGPEAEAACDQMREGVERLKALGMCMKPGYPGGVGPETLWYRCEPQAVNRPADAGKEVLCRLVEELFSSAARMREDGASPQTAEEELLWQWTGRAPEITRERIRETVDRVYFDPDFSSSWSRQLQYRVRDSCLSGTGPYIRPLK